MLSLATSRPKKPSAQPLDPNIRLGETAARRSFFLVRVIFADVCLLGPKHHYCNAAICPELVWNAGLHLDSARTVVDRCVSRQPRRALVATGFKAPLTET